MKKPSPLFLLRLSVVACALAVISTPAAVCAANTPATSPAASGVASAAAALELKTARARAFITRYLGVWEGTSTVYLLDGGHSQTLSVHVTYRRDRENPEIISGQAVFAAGERMVHATSKIFIHDGAIFCQVEFQGKKEVYNGQLAADGSSINWTKAGSVLMLGASSKDTFSTQADGTAELTFEGFENLDNQETTLTQRTQLTRISQ